MSSTLLAVRKCDDQVLKVRTREKKAPHSFLYFLLLHELMSKSWEIGDYKRV